jgi:autotransporter-associated beta strand protein
VTSPQIASLAGNGSVVLGAQTLQLTGATGTFAGIITGSGGVTVKGGTQTLTGINSYTGLTHVSGGTLAGTGTVSSVTVDSGGTLAPGVSGTGTLNIDGNLTMAAGSTYLVNLSSSASSSGAAVTGTASLAGTLAVASPDGTYLLGQKTTVLTAAGGISGSFTVTPIQGSGAQFAPTLSYDANDVYLQINLAKLSPLLPGTATANQVRAVGGIDAAIAAGSTLPSAIQNLGNVSSAALASDADQMSGEIGADLPLAGAALFDPFVDAVFDHIADIRQGYRSKGGIQQHDIWASGFVGSVLVSGDDDTTGSNKFKSHAAGFAGGADWLVAPDFTLGAAVSAGATNFHLANDLGSGRVDGYQLGVYGVMQFNPMLYGAFAGGLALDDITTNRTLAISGTSQLTGKANAVMAGGRFEAGLKMGFMSPYFALRDQLISVPGYGEAATAGSADFALKYDARTTNTAGTELGFRQSADIPLDRTWRLKLSDSMAWAHDMSGAPTATPQFADISSSGFDVTGARASRDAALISLGILLHCRNGLGLDAHFNSKTSANSQSYTGLVGVNYAW